MRKHGGTSSRQEEHVTLAAISPPGVARGRFVGGQQSGLAGCKPPPLLTRGASSCSSQGRRQGEPWGASPRPSAPTYLPEDREHKITNGQQEVDLKLMKSVWGAHVRMLTPSSVPMMQLTTRDDAAGPTICVSRAERPRQGC